MIGIYAIVNKHNRKVYVGQSVNIQKRFKQHLDALEKGRHHSKKLQEDFNEFGPDKFAIEILELCTREQLDQKELEWITRLNSLQNGYNVQDPKTRKRWALKREKSPAKTIRGELFRTIRDFTMDSAEEFKTWLIEHKKSVQQALLLYSLFIGFVTLLILIVLGYHLLSLLIPNLFYFSSALQMIYIFLSIGTILFYIGIVAYITKER